ncbi:MAG: inorganic diphosphatase [Candidatus Izemoplasmatales bacterium]|nr:inorganic diphosphatase [Candidatus Izemoplasmatales bacterium]MDD4595852.1 inorganic diphosphatase [Candidatus Izemoplasmatales bacterium]
MNQIIEAIIEIPMGTQNKYEVDKTKNRIKLSRVLYSKMTYPAEYGFIENTYAEDGDPLDILVLATTQTFPGCIVDARVVGYLDMIDSGARDAKVIAVVNADPRFDTIQDITDIPQLQLREIKLFFRTYKELLPNHEVEVRDYHNCEEALILIDKCLRNYQKRQNK